MQTQTFEPVVVEQSFATPIDKVWGAITDLHQMRVWFFPQIEAFSPRAGFTTQFDVRNGDKVYPHIWRITEAIPRKKIVYDWRYGGYPGKSTVTFALSTQGGMTTLKLTHEGLESFPQGNPDFSKESCTAGWRGFICVRLKEYLEES